MTGDTANPVCPACTGVSRPLAEWEYSGLNDSVFNYTASFYECWDCGLVYVANISDETLARFYTDECSYFEKAHFEITAPANIQKYRFYRGVLERAGLAGRSVTDVGCGRGGFLLWLEQNNWGGDCLGVDIDLKSIPSEAGRGTTFQEGKALALPFADGTRSLLSYFHVLEHIRNLDRVLAEAARVLHDTGCILIEVPDAERYKDIPVGTAFWFSLREHINHFSPRSIARALERHGFSVHHVYREVLPTPEFSYPSLTILANKGASHDGTEAPSLPWAERTGWGADSTRIIGAFVRESKAGLLAQAGELKAFCSRYTKQTFWGCSAELFSLLPLLSSEDFGICDSSSLKQRCSYRGVAIESPATIQKTGALIVAPYLHGEAIERAAIENGWAKDVVFRLR